MKCPGKAVEMGFKT